MKGCRRIFLLKSKSGSSARRVINRINCVEIRFGTDAFGFPKNWRRGHRETYTNRLLFAAKENANVIQISRRISIGRHCKDVWCPTTHSREETHFSSRFDSPSLIEESGDLLQPEKLTSFLLGSCCDLRARKWQNAIYDRQVGTYRKPIKRRVVWRLTSASLYVHNCA